MLERCKLFDPILILKISKRVWTLFLYIFDVSGDVIERKKEAGSEENCGIVRFHLFVSQELVKGALTNW